MINMCTVDMRTGAYQLHGKTRRSHIWRVRVTATFDDHIEELDFVVKRKLPLRKIIHELGDMVTNETRKIENVHLAKSVVVDVGIAKKRANRDKRAKV